MEKQGSDLNAELVKKGSGGQVKNKMRAPGCCQKQQRCPVDGSKRQGSDTSHMLVADHDVCVEGHVIST